MSGQRFAQRVVVVTGGAGGIGLALAEVFGAQRAKVALLDRDPSALEDACRTLQARGVEAHCVVCDVSDPAACERAMEQVRERLGPVEVLINNAGITAIGPFAQTELAVFRRVMEVNFFGALHCTQAALGDLRKSRGMVIVISSIAGVAPLWGRSAYSASKHALHGLFETLRAELSAEGVQVLMVCPGFTESKLERTALGPDGRPLGKKRSQVGRTAPPQSVAEAVLRAAAGGRRLLVLSPVGKLAFVLSHLAPRLYERRMVENLARGHRGVPA